MATEFTAILLAGGRSTRMGRDKALLDWNGRPLIDHMIARLRDAGASVRVSGDRPGHGGVPDASAGRGPVGGIASVVPRCPDGAVLVVPVDMPLLAGSRFQTLRDALRHHRAAHFQDQPLPCAFRLDADARERVARFMDSGESESLRALLAALGAHALPVGDGHDLRPCNTPAEFAALAR